MPQGQAPEQIEPRSLSDYLKQMAKSVFRSGMSWRVVDSKWPDIRDAVRGFDTEVIANLSPADLDALTQDKRVIRNRRKLEAIVHNAQRILELQAMHGSFRGYLRSHEDFDATVKDVRKQFKFMGDTGTYLFLFVVGEEVPSYEEWHTSRAG